VASTLEPYTGQELQTWLTGRGFTFHHQSGDHVFYAKGDLIVPAGGARSTEHVTAPMATRLAQMLGLSNARSIREALGYSRNCKGGGRRIPPPPNSSRGTAINAIDSIAHVSHRLNRDRARYQFTDRQADELRTVQTILTRIEKELRVAA